jgi:hypothetical protein
MHLEKGKGATAKALFWTWNPRWRAMQGIPPAKLDTLERIGVAGNAFPTVAFLLTRGLAASPQMMPA